MLPLFAHSALRRQSEFTSSRVDDLSIALGDTGIAILRKLKINQPSEGLLLVHSQKIILAITAYFDVTEILKVFCCVTLLGVVST